MMKMTDEIEEKEQPRIIVRLELTPSAKEHLHTISRRNGMAQVTVTSRLVEWFATQSELVQAAILGHYPHAIQAEIAELILKRMTGVVRKKR
jgi:hypothetical protein